jgi:hypothetical protein
VDYPLEAIGRPVEETPKEVVKVPSVDALLGFI